MNFSRKIKRNKAKNRAKHARKALKTMGKRMDSLGESCRACGKPFDKKDPEALSSWVVYVEDNDARLVCPTCKKKIDELVREQEDDDVGINEAGGAEAQANTRVGVDSDTGE